MQGRGNRQCVVDVTLPLLLLICNVERLIKMAFYSWKKYSIKIKGIRQNVLKEGVFKDVFNVN